MPTSPAPYHQIQIIDHIVFVTLHGFWSASADRAYMSDLIAATEQVHGNPWGIAVDMRQWSMHSEPMNIFEQNVSNIYMDRTGQCCECWLVSHLNQASELSPFVESITHVQFKRVLSESHGNTWLANFQLTHQAVFQPLHNMI